MYEARQNKERVSRTISQLRKKDVREDSISKNVMQCLVRQDDQYNVSNSDINEKFAELNYIQNTALYILYNHLNWNYPISHAQRFFKSFNLRNERSLHSDWGYCIEEVMNVLAKNSGWECQVELEHSRPDYRLKIMENSNEKYIIYADSTSNNVSMNENTHVGGKLRRANVSNNNVAAADIAYGDDTLNNMIECINRRNRAQINIPQWGMSLFRNSSVNVVNTSSRRKARSWTEEEDFKLLLAVQYYGTNWKAVSTIVATRDQAQCRQRWKRYLDPNLSKEPWTPDEENKLKNLVDKYGEKSWVKIAAEMEHRSDVQCRYRYNQIKKNKI